MVTNRGPDTISTFSTDDLSLLCEVPSGGRWPRHLAQHDDLVLVSNQHSDQVTVFRLGLGGRLSQVASHDIASPSCLVTRTFPS